MNTDRIEELGKRIVKSDLWNIGLHGIFVKEVDKINMSETSANITKKVILGLETLAIGVTAWACAKGYIAPTQESNTGNTNNSSEVDPSLNAEQSNQEKLVNYGQFLIGEAKIGKISDLTLQTNPNQEEVDKIKSLAYQIIPETKNKDLSVNIYDMVGSEGTAPFVTVSINNKDGNLEFAYVGFSIDENNIQRPPQDGDIQIFYPLRVVEQDDNSNFIGIPDATTKNLQVPVMFFIDTQGNSYFYPPYTDYVAQESNPSGGMKVSAIVFKPEAPVESPLTQGPISELQATLGENYKLTKAKEGDYFVIDEIENLKFNQDGTAELVYSGEDLTVAFQAISLDGEKLNIGPWQYNKEGEVTMLTAGAPKTVEEADLFPKLAYLEGHAKEKEIDLTIHKYVQMATAETAKSEFDEIYNEDGEKILENAPRWNARESQMNEGMKIIQLDTGSYSQLIALQQGYANLDVYDADGKLKLDLNIIPIVIINNDGTIFSMVGLMDTFYLPKLIEYLTIEDRNYPGIGFAISTSGEDGVDNFTSKDLQEFMLIQNQNLITNDVIKPPMDQLPLELNTEGFWGLGI